MKTLGEILTEKNLITPAQLNQAIQCQILFGGKLGTVLLELGHITEKDLAEALSEKYQVEAVTLEELKEIPEEVIKTLPKDLVIRYEMIPFRKLAKRLYLAMLNPDDQEALEEAEKACGLKPIPYVILEVYYRWALERYYGVKREGRFIQLERNLELMRELYPYAGLSAREPGESLWVGSEPLPEISDSGITRKKQTEETEPPSSLDEFWEQAGRQGYPRLILPQYKERLRGAQTQEQIADIILEFAQNIFSRLALFYISGQVAFGWKGKGEGIQKRNLASLMIPLELESILKTVYQTGAHFLGPVPDSAVNQRILLALGGIIPSQAIVMPIYIFGKIALLLYADFGSQPPERSPDLASLEELLGEAQLAFQRLITDSKMKNEPE